MTLQFWRGRFGPAAGINFDSRLFNANIDGSKAYAKVIKRAGWLTYQECKSILKGLEAVRIDWIKDMIKFHNTDQDVHSINERRLNEIVGFPAQYLEMGRSRNDRDVTDLKVWLRKSIQDICQALTKVIETAMDQAERHMGILMPGYTHLQRAQPVQFSHWLLSHAFAFREDCERFRSVYKRLVCYLPLGSGALAGNPLDIDHQWLADLMDFSGPAENSMHAVSDRDFVVDFVYSCSLVSLHLSRLAEDVIIYATREFGFVKISEEYSTGSRLMPKRRNPDSLELVRGASGSVCACLNGIMMTLKGIPSTFSEDLQFDKQYCFDAHDKLQQILGVTEGVLRTMRVNRQQMTAALTPEMMATDLSYHLVRKGVPFRKAHYYIGKLVEHARKSGVALTQLPSAELCKICPYFNKDTVLVANFAETVESYKGRGSTATKSITKQLEVLKKSLKSFKTWTKAEKHSI